MNSTESELVKDHFIGDAGVLSGAFDRMYAAAKASKPKTPLQQEIEAWNYRVDLEKQEKKKEAAKRNFRKIIEHGANYGTQPKRT